MDPVPIARVYFDAWNRRDAAAVLATFTATVPAATLLGDRSPWGRARRVYERAVGRVPDLSFEITSAGATGPDSVAAEWIMRGTNSAR